MEFYKPIKKKRGINGGQRKSQRGSCSDPPEKEKTVSSVEARVEKYLSSDDISIFVENKAAKPDEFIENIGTSHCQSGDA